MRAYCGRARNALARTLEPPEKRPRLEVAPWAWRAWLLVAALALAAWVAKC